MSEFYPSIPRASDGAIDREPGPGVAEARAMLQEHRAFLASLARALTRDPGAADDLAQETMIEGLGLAKSAGRPAHERRWLVTVLRRKAINRMRSESRRARREEQAARPERLAGPDVTVSQLEVGERLMALVRGLDEPVREAVAARFYRGLSYPAIAAEAGVPETTIKSRVDRGLKVLREQMDRSEAGGREAWLSALGGLVGGLVGGGRGASAPTGHAGGGLSAGIGWAAAAVIVFVAATALWLRRDTAAPLGTQAPGAVAWDAPGVMGSDVGGEELFEFELSEIGYSGSVTFEVIDVLAEPAEPEETPAVIPAGAGGRKGDR